jgi:hypothetical protein
MSQTNGGATSAPEARRCASSRGPSSEPLTTGASTDKGVSRPAWRDRMPAVREPIATIRQPQRGDPRTKRLRREPEMARLRWSLRRGTNPDRSCPDRASLTSPFPPKAWISGRQTGATLSRRSSCTAPSTATTCASRLDAASRRSRGVKTPVARAARTRCSINLNPRGGCCRGRRSSR